MFIQEFKIEALFGYKDVDIIFNHPVLILIGENGFGKTTILNALNYTLQGCYKELLDIKFDAIEIKIDGDLYAFKKEELYDYYEFISSDSEKHYLVSYLKKQLSPTEFYALRSMVNQNKKRLTLEIPNPILKQFPDRLIFHEMRSYLECESRYSVFRSLKKRVEASNLNILFNPTYRRVEADLKPKIGNDLYRRDECLDEYENKRRKSYAATVIRYGMEDVHRKITKITETIKTSSLQGFAKVSSDMIRHLLDDKAQITNSLNINVDSIRIILDRAGDSLSKEEKEKIIEQIENKRVASNEYLLFFLKQLYQVYDEQKHLDAAIKQFRDVCNGYLKEKQFFYDESRVELKIYRTNHEGFVIAGEKNEVKLNDLSSGEKQIVSLFAQIYLDIDRKFVMLLDEPELSLSIYWQEKLLSDIYRSNRCEFMLSVTHSPFIFRKSMKEYVVGLQEFLSYTD